MNTRALLSLSLAGVLAALLPSTAPAQAAGTDARSADTVLVGGRIWTGNPGQPEAQALAIVGDEIVAVGSDDEVRRWAGPGTRVMELRGRRVVPGFNDAHVHFFDGGQGLASVQPRDAGSPEVLRDRIGTHPARR